MVINDEIKNMIDVDNDTDDDDDLMIMMIRTTCIYTFIITIWM